MKPVFVCIFNCPARIGANKKPLPIMMRRGLKTIALFSSFPPPQLRPELDLAPDIEVRNFNRLPWRHRASPSTTRDEFVDINECG
jgi:hypothetical protein